MIDSSGTDVYCTPDDVAMAMDLPSPDDPFKTMAFDDMSHPSFEQVERMIRSNSEMIDRRLRRSWRENRVKDRVVSIDVYEHDENTWRTEYWLRGGNFVQLERDLRPLDPAKGDKVEVRSFSGQWRDVSAFEGNDADPSENQCRFWVDPERGRLFYRANIFQPRYNTLRLTYRWGSEEPAPEAIRRLCVLLTMIQILQTQPFFIKVGQGGDLGMVRQDMIKTWTEESNYIWGAYQRPSAVFSMYG